MRPTTLFRDTPPQFNRGSTQRRRLHQCKLVTAREWVEPAYRKSMPPLPPARPSGRVMLAFAITCIFLGWLMTSLLLP